MSTAARTHNVEQRRPELTRREQQLGVTFGIWMVIGLFLDGAAHDDGQIESFFTPWHGVLYTGFAASAATAALVTVRSRVEGQTLLATMPRGHALTLVGLAIFATGGIGDLLWHETLGIEIGIEALLSPTHLLLLVGGVAALSAPVRAAWTDTQPGPTDLRGFFPTVLGIALLTAVAAFFLMYLSPFVNDAAGSGFTRVAGTPHDHPASDPAEIRQILGVASILTYTIVLSVPAHALLRRWRPPIGSFSILFTTVTILFMGLSGWKHPWLSLAGPLAGLVADATARSWPPHVVVPASISALWLSYFGLYELTAGGVAWSPELWSGSIVLSALVSGALGIATVHSPTRPAVASSPASDAGLDTRSWELSREENADGPSSEVPRGVPA